jgi:hypothetical protein
VDGRACTSGIVGSEGSMLYRVNVSGGYNEKNLQNWIYKIGGP